MNSAKLKKKVFKEIFKEYAHENLKHMIVFVGQCQIVNYLKIIDSFGIRVARFDSTFTKKERELMLEHFDTGTIQVLVAIRCLDEGVDMPQAKVGILVSSTTNPREFIQRRGRLLRNFEGKIESIIHDLIVLNDIPYKMLMEKMAYREIPRVSEFSMHASNKLSARCELYDLLKKHNLEGLLDKSPWDVYHERKVEYLDEEDFRK